MFLQNNEADMDICDDVYPDAPATNEPVNQSASIKRNALAQYFWVNSQWIKFYKRNKTTCFFKFKTVLLFITMLLNWMCNTKQVQIN